ncbi:MAG TPA: hypothetical protein H9691_03890 [Firmicutes bacterium]|nr:hypothetical protein [Bacillota bacterium]
MIYYALTTYHVLCCVLHRLSFLPKEEESVLVLSDIHRNSVAFLNRYRESGIFSRIVLLPESDVMATAKYLERKKMPTGFIYKKCCRDMGALLKNERLSLAGQDLALCPDHFPFGWYVRRHRYPYHCMEEGCGVLSDRAFALSNMQRNKTQAKLFTRLGCFGDNDCAIELLGDRDHQQPGYNDPRLTDFSVAKLLKALPAGTLQKVLAFFGVEETFSLAPHSVLLLTQHLANLGLMPLPDQHRFYTLFADLLLPKGPLMIKPHPDDIAGTYHAAFHTPVQVLPFAMPSELLPYCVKGTFSLAAAAYSTSVRTLSNVAQDTLCFDDRILKNWRYLPQYAAAARFLKAAGFPRAVTDGDEGVLSQVCRLQGASTTITRDENLLGADVVIFSDLNESRTPKQTAAFLRQHPVRCAIFLQETEQHAYFDGENRDIFPYVRPIPLQIGDEQKVITVVSKEDILMKTAENLNETIELPHTGLTIDLQGIARAERDKIRVLEGVLAATEKRLNDYISEDKARTAESGAQAK